LCLGLAYPRSTRYGRVQRVHDLMITDGKQSRQRAARWYRYPSHRLRIGRRRWGVGNQRERTEGRPCARACAVDVEVRYTVTVDKQYVMARAPATRGPTRRAMHASPACGGRLKTLGDGPDRRPQGGSGFGFVSGDRARQRGSCVRSGRRRPLIAGRRHAPSRCVVRTFLVNYTASFDIFSGA
jgi:hypothetical protein